MAQNHENNVSHIHTAYSKQVLEQEAQNASERRQLIKIRKKRSFAIISVFVVFVLFFGVQIIQSRASLRDTNAQVAKQETKLKTVKKTNQNLKKQVKLLNNSDYLQKVIRQKYYYSKQGETIYNLPTQTTASTTTSSK
ncbi:FtsB family cell division protein [Paucilactobacillus wasatchensis]|uniref:Cell division protein n=1 Tax=Paucilactobacillus wasatchensis TaxID=1335616 RepID=A0A0D0Y7E3_9LACO|nr:septum formation initiator family protein [Paucilactobacillus wasatchensis]KIS04188.1 Cell division protein [Paucilactobacillus wasatchensis]